MKQTEGKRIIRIGTRESRLAMVQAEMVAEAIGASGKAKAQLIPMKTTGDKILGKALAEIGGKGLFMKELDTALFAGETDISVHCVKDMTMELPEAYPILGVSRREDPRDVLVLPRGKTEIDPALPVGCSSLRRQLQFARLYPGLSMKSVRGNVLTRLEKLDRGEYGALLLAAAGLKRLGLEERISRVFTTEEMIPAAGQGVLAVQGAADLDLSCLNAFFDRDAFYAVQAERAYIRTLDGGCTSPLCAFAKIEGDTLTLHALYTASSNGEPAVGKQTEDVPEGDAAARNVFAMEQPFITGTVSGSKAEAELLGTTLAKQLQERFRS